MLTGREFLLHVCVAAQYEREPPALYTKQCGLVTSIFSGSPAGDHEARAGAIRRVLTDIRARGGAIQWPESNVTALCVTDRRRHSLKARTLLSWPGRSWAAYVITRDKANPTSIGLYMYSARRILVEQRKDKL